MSEAAECCGLIVVSTLVGRGESDTGYHADAGVAARPSWCTCASARYKEEADRSR